MACNDSATRPVLERLRGFWGDGAHAQGWALCALFLSFCHVQAQAASPGDQDLIRERQNRLLEVIYTAT